MAKRHMKEPSRTAAWRRLSVALALILAALFIIWSAERRNAARLIPLEVVHVSLTPLAAATPEETPAPTPGSATREVSYVLNTNTHRFHKPDCSSVQDMKAKNRRDFTGTRDDLLAQGYKPCGRCNP